MKPTLPAILILALPLAPCSHEQPQEGAVSAWRGMLPDVPVQFRSTIGAVRSGNRLVVWGGEVGGDASERPASDGAVYDIVRDTWKEMAPAPIEGREHFTMVATDHDVIIWGGENNPRGAIYDVERDTWRPMAESPVTLGMEPYTSGIMGPKLLVWGIGRTRDLNPVGAIYDIAADTWQEMAPLPSLKAIDSWPPFFYNDKFVVWGLPNDGDAGRYGAIYNVGQNRWQEMAAAPIERRNWSAAVLVGGRLILWGGCEGPVEAHTGTSRSDGAVYDIDNDAWREMSASPLEPRWAPRAFAWGEKVVIWGGMGRSDSEDKFFYYDGAVYDLLTDTWERIPEAPVTSAQARQIRSYGIFGYNPTPPSLLGDKLVVWSHYSQAVYDLVDKAWTKMAPAPISERDYQISLLFGDELLVWGGRDDQGLRSDGAILRIAPSSPLPSSLPPTS